MVLNIFFFLRVSLNPPHYEESFSSSGVHRELSSILKEIRVIRIIFQFNKDYESLFNITIR